MKILITGNVGYIGSMLAKYLRKSRPHAKLVGYDSGFFAHCLSNAQYLPEFDYSEQHWGDLRSFSVELLAGVDAVVHLAAISNDPMGKRFERVTFFSTATIFEREVASSFRYHPRTWCLNLTQERGRQKNLGGRFCSVKVEGVADCFKSVEARVTAIRSMKSL